MGITHKVYVTGYRPLEDPEIVPPKRPSEPLENIGVGHSLDSGWWSISSRVEAETECSKLRGWKIHVGAHYCDFAVESLEDGKFAIICLSHPVELALMGKVKEQTSNLEKRPYGVLCFSCQRPVLVGYTFLEDVATVEDLRGKITNLGGIADCNALMDDGSICGAANHVVREELVFADDAVSAYDAGLIEPTLD